MEAIRVLTISLVGVLVLTNSAIAQNTCNGSISAVHTGGGTSSCPGSLWERKDFTVSGQTKCEHPGVGQQFNLAGAQISGTASGTCNGSAVQCPFQPVQSSVMTGDSGTEVTLAWGNGVLVGAQCDINDQTEYDIFPEQTTCMGNACCAGQGACESQMNREWDAANCTCWVTPLVVSLSGEWQDTFTSARRGVPFTLLPGEPMLMVAWPRRAQRTVGWLVRDRNGNGSIDDASELYGSATPQFAGPGQPRHGFVALATEDTNGDRVITNADVNYGELALWFDRNHDGRSDTEELVGLDELGISRLDLRYRPFGQADAAGNIFLYEGVGVQQSRNTLRRIRLYDVVVRTDTLPTSERR